MLQCYSCIGSNHYKGLMIPSKAKVSMFMRSEIKLIWANGRFAT